MRAPVSPKKRLAPVEAPASVAAPGLRRRRKDARPSELTAAALELFVEKGFAATRLDDVAKRAGVSKGTLYLYFDSKEALFNAAVEEGIVPHMVAAEERIADFDGSAAELLRELLFGWWEQIGGTRLAGIPKLVISESRNFPDIAQYYHDKVIVRGRALLRAALLRGVASGEFRPLDVETVIDVIIAPLLMLVIWKYSLCFCGTENDPQRYLTTHFDLLVRGLRPEGSALGVRPEGSPLGGRPEKNPLGVRPAGASPGARPAGNPAVESPAGAGSQGGEA